MNDTECCNNRCDQGRTCPAREAQGNVIQLHQTAEKRKWFSPMKDIVVDFAAFWKMPHINWEGVAFFAVLGVSGYAAYMAISGMVQIFAGAW